MRVTLKNELVNAELETLGGELISLQDVESGREYLWNGDSAYWGRHSPILFPFVGKTKLKEFRTKGTTYSMTPHGFARDMEFELVNDTDSNEVWMKLSSNEETLAKYPYEFSLYLGYRLEGRSLTVLWKVENPAKETLYFSIGGHPAFLCPIDTQLKQTDYQLLFDTTKPLSVTPINQDGLALDKKDSYPLDNGILSITENLFEHDALIIEHHQAHQVSFLKKGDKPYLTIKFDAPLFGVWAPYKKDVPFICIEPWYGRCDKETYAGTLEEREWGNQLEAGKTWEASYVISI